MLGFVESRVGPRRSISASFAFFACFVICSFRAVQATGADSSPPAGQWFNGFSKDLGNKATKLEKKLEKIGEEQGLWDKIRQYTSNIETPGISWDLKPEKTLFKVRKALYPLGLTKLTVGADYNPMTSEFKLETTWRDVIVGGNIAIEGTEVALTKSFDVDTRSALFLRAAFDWKTKKSLLGFKIKPIEGLSANVGAAPSFHFRKELGVHDKLKLEIDSDLTLPEAAYTATSEGKISLGLGDFFVDLKELNFIVEL